MKRILIKLGVLIFGLTSKTLIACSCILQTSVRKEYKNSDIVVRGQIISTTQIYYPDSACVKEFLALGYTDPILKTYCGNYYKKVLVKVENIFKGKSISDTLTIYTGNGGGDCGYNFTSGHTYIIYGSINSNFSYFDKDLNLPKGQNIYSTDICTRTQELNWTEISELEKIVK